MIHIDFTHRYDTNDVSFDRRTVMIIGNPFYSTILIEVKRYCYW